MRIFIPFNGSLFIIYCDPPLVTHALLTGADGKLLNEKKETPCDVTRDHNIKEILSQYGYGETNFQVYFSKK